VIQLPMAGDRSHSLVSFGRSVIDKGKSVESLSLSHILHVRLRAFDFQSSCLDLKSFLKKMKKDFEIFQRSLNSYSSCIKGKSQLEEKSSRQLGIKMARALNPSNSLKSLPVFHSVKLYPLCLQLEVLHI